MNKKVIVSTIITMYILIFGVSSSFGEASTTSLDQKGAFIITVNGSEKVTISASTGVLMVVSIDNTAASTSATVGAIHGKGNFAYALDTDGGPLYRFNSSVGQAAVPGSFPVATTGADDFAPNASKDTWTTF